MASVYRHSSSSDYIDMPCQYICVNSFAIIETSDRDMGGTASGTKAWYFR